MPREIDDFTLAHQKVRDREYRAYVRHIKKMKTAKKRGRPAKLKPTRILAIADAQTRALEDHKPVNAYYKSLHAMFGSGDKFRSFLSRHRAAIERTRINGGLVLDDGLPHLRPHKKNT
jgi:hypothetical protein